MRRTRAADEAVFEECPLGRRRVNADVRGLDHLAVHAASDRSFSSHITDGALESLMRAAR